MLVSKACLSTLAIAMDDIDLAADVFTSNAEQVFFDLPEHVRENLERLRQHVQNDIVLVVALDEIQADETNTQTQQSTKNVYYISRTAACILAVETNNMSLLERAKTSTGKFVHVTEEEAEELQAYLREYLEENVDRLFQTDEHKIVVGPRDMLLIMSWNELDQAIESKKSLQ